MSDCFMYGFPGRSISFRSVCDDGDLQAAARVLDAIDELRPVIEPLSAELTLNCRNKQTQWKDNEVNLPFPVWYIHEASLPESIVIETYLKEPQNLQTQQLNQKTLIDWIERASLQECPFPDTHEVVWSSLHISAVRARILDSQKFKGRESFVVKTDRGKFSFPLERRDDELWVDSPIKDFKSQPSFVISTSHEEGGLSFNIHVHWSWWTETSPEDANALHQALLRILEQGWQLDYCSTEFWKLDGCDAYLDTNDSVVLWFPPPTKSASSRQWTMLAIDALEELRPVLEPLCVDLSISGYRLGTQDWRNWDCDTEPSMPSWFAHVSNVPETVRLKSLSDSALIEQAPELSKEYLLNWIERALQQDYSSDTHALDWFSLYINAVRARIYGEENFLGRDLFKLKTRHDIWQFPLENKADGLWVYGWYEKEYREPLGVMIKSDIDGMRMYLSVNWSLWKQNDSAEYNALRQSLLRIVDRGWKVESDEIFQL
jgi:hypothetical protein